MMTSSGSGSYRVGGSLSSSNLSPLAPPFKVDKLLSKQNSMNPSVNFVDGPVYGSCFDPAPGQFWSSSTSSASGPKCVATESVVTNNNRASSPNVYRYQDSQSNTSQTGMYYGSGNGVTPFDPFSYDPLPNSMSSNANEAEKSYFVPYVSPPPQKDGYLSLGVGSEPGYDFLSYSGSAHMSGDVPAQVDHVQVMPSDVGYKSKWGSFWSSLGESEHDKWTDYVQGCAPKDLNASKFSSNKSPISVDGSHGTNKSQTFVDANVRPFVDGSNITHLFDDLSNRTHLKNGASLTQDVGLYEQASTAKDNCFDIFGGACSLNRLGIEQQSSKLFECSKNKTSAPVSNASASASKETPRLQEPVLGSISNICGSQKANISSSEGHFGEPGYFMFGCASSTSTFPKALSELPYGGTISSVGTTPSAIKRFSMGIDTADQLNTTGGYSFSYQMEGQMPLGTKRHTSIRIRKPVSSIAASSCQTGDIDNTRHDDKVSSEQMKFSSQLPHQSSLDGSNMEDSDVEAVYSVEKRSAGSDGHNPAEDSPCWKGASSHRFSPFGHSESVDSDGLVKNIDSCKSLSSQDLPISSILSNTFGSNGFSSGKTNKATSLEKPPVNDSTLKGNEDCGYANPNFFRFDLNTGDSLRFAEDCHASMVECNMINKSKADLSEALPSEECGTRSSVEKNLSGLKSSNDNNVSNLLPGNKASLKSSSEDSNLRIDINGLLRTMMNLSETFRCYCFSNRAEVSEKQTLAVKKILCNLNASMLLISGQTISTTVLSPPDKLILKEFPVQMVNDAEVLAASLKLGGTTEDFPEYISTQDDENSFADANMIEAVKKLISEDFQEEDTDQQKLLYKSLWLEAEASLCAMTAKARFLRLKTETKRTHDGVKDKDKPTRSNVDMGLHKDIELTNDNSHSPSISEYPEPTKTSHIKVLHDPKAQVGCVDFTESERSTSTKNESFFPSSRPGASGNKENLCSTSQGNDVETCVMARYQILKDRVGFLDSLNYENNLASGVHTCPSSEFDVGNTYPASGANIKANDPEISVFGGYQILKGQDDNTGSPNYEGQQLPGDENYLPDNDFLNDKALQDSQMSNSLGVTADSEASVMARFRLIQSRIDHLNSLNNDSVPRQASAVLVDGTDDMGEDEKDNVKKTSYGPYPQLTEDETVNNFDIDVDEQAFDPILKTSKMSSVILEGWYDNGCSSSDWEHISSGDVLKN